MVSKLAPGFIATAVFNVDVFKDVNLSDYKNKYLVLMFYPSDFTSICPTEIIAFDERIEEFKKLNCNVIACSTDSEFSHSMWLTVPRKKGGIEDVKIPLLSDRNHQISKKYGVLDEDKGVALRALFIIDFKGVIRHVTINDNQVGRRVDDFLRLVEAFQYSDKFGGVCEMAPKRRSEDASPL